MSCSDLPGLLPLATGMERLLNAIDINPHRERIPLAQSLNRVSAEPVRAEAPVPGVDNSAMDGYAVRIADLTPATPLPVQGSAFAGAPLAEPLAPGRCVRIMTGAAVPQGCDAVIMQEKAKVTDAGVLFQEIPPAGNNIRRAGEDIQVGDTVIPARRRIRPIELALLSTVGCSEVSVYRRTRVGLFATGDELRQPGEPLGYGDLYDSNRPALRALLERLDTEVIDLGVIPDDPDRVREAFLQADQECDFIVTSGGVSVGEADYTRDILGELGDIEFWRLAIKPGKPFAFGRLPGSWFIGLPGNPVSSIVTFHLLGAQAIRQHQGTGAQPLQRLTARVSTGLRKTPGRMDFQRGFWTQAPDGIVVTPTRPSQGSHILTSLAEANCYIALEQERGPVEANETVTLWLFDGLMS